MARAGFEKERLSEDELAHLKELARICRGDILTMTTLAASGHPGGSMSSLDMYLLVYHCANIAPDNLKDPGRDRVVISHGHTSPAVYSCLARNGFFDPAGPLAGFRKAGSIFEGHVEPDVPGAEWGTGNLGQGLSVACGMALASKILGKDFHVFCFMSDGEQQKGQPSEARRFAVKYGLSNITVLIDRNHIQISGRTDFVMPQDLAAEYRADGWEVIETDGHDFQALYQALRRAVHNKERPTAIIAKTIIGKGVSFMEDTPTYHGKALSPEEYARAMAELGLEPQLERYKKLRESLVPVKKHPREIPIPEVSPGEPITYGPEEKLDNRGAWGKALVSLADANPDVPIAVFDCDLASSVKTDAFWKKYENRFFECGVAEHNAASASGVLSTQGVLTFFADFGVFGLVETYNQHRLNDINGSNLKVVLTHCGLDVGEDGKTHQCIDYVGAPANFFGWKVIVPADPNQTDRAVRYAATHKGNFIIAVGRSKVPVITAEDGSPFFAGDYRFEYGKMDVVREGGHAAILALGAMLPLALKAREQLSAKGIEAAVVSVSCPLALDLEMLSRLAQTGVIVTYEDHCVKSGLGLQVEAALGCLGARVRIATLGVTDYGGSGKPEELYEMQGLSPTALAQTVERLVRG